MCNANRRISIKILFKWLVVYVMLTAHPVGVIYIATYVVQAFTQIMVYVIVVWVIAQSAQIR